MNIESLRPLLDRKNESAKSLAAAKKLKAAIEARRPAVLDELLRARQALSEAAAEDSPARIENLLAGRETSNAAIEALDRRVANCERDCNALTKELQRVTDEMIDLVRDAQRDRQNFVDAVYMLKAGEVQRRITKGEPLGQRLSDLYHLQTVHGASPSTVFVSTIASPATPAGYPSWRIDLCGPLGDDVRSNGVDLVRNIEAEILAGEGAAEMRLS